MTDKMRGEFEEWAVSQGMSIQRYERSYSEVESMTAWMAWQACAARMVPEGYVVVPRYSTGAMDIAGAEAANIEGFDRFKAETVYLAMLSAAPEGKK